MSLRRKRRVAPCRFCGFRVSDLKFTDDLTKFGRATGLGIILNGPLGSSEFNNEFGRPTVAGYFRVFEENHHGETWGFRKPIMLAGGWFNFFE